MRIMIDSDSVKMPRFCTECIIQFGGICFAEPSWVDDARVPFEGKPDWCPLKEIKEGEDKT